MMRYAFFFLALSLRLVYGADRNVVDRRLSQTLEELIEEYPTIDKNTIARFHEDGHQVTKKLSHFLQWQNGHNIKAVESDTERWNLAVQQGFDYVSKRQQGQLRATTLEHAPKHQVVFDTEFPDRSGHPVLLFFPCLLDLDLEGAIPLYTDILVSYIESFFAGIEDPHEKFTLLFDIRPGRGFPNPTQASLISAVKKMASSVHELQPGRVSKVIVFPVPTVGMKVWEFLIKPFVTSTLHEQIVLVHGSSAGLHGPVPVGELEKYVEKNVIDHAEEKRHSLFTPQTTVDELIEEEGVVTEDGEEPETDSN